MTRRNGTSPAGKSGWRLPTHPDDIRTGLTEAGQRLVDSARAAAEAKLDLARWMAEAEHYGYVASGELTVTEMAELGRVSRVTATKWLDEAAELRASQP